MNTEEQENLARNLLPPDNSGAPCPQLPSLFQRKAELRGDMQMLRTAITTGRLTVWEIGADAGERLPAILNQVIARAHSEGNLRVVVGAIKTILEMSRANASLAADADRSSRLDAGRPTSISHAIDDEGRARIRKILDGVATVRSSDKTDLVPVRLYPHGSSLPDPAD